MNQYNKQQIGFILFILVALIAGLFFYFYQNRNVSSLKNRTADISPTPTSTQNIAPASKGSILNLSNQNLTKVPDSVFNQTGLKELNVSNNKIGGAVQSQINQLKSLAILNLSNNQMTGLPAEIGQLSNLEVLDVSNNKLSGLPYEIGNLQKLKTFKISGNSYSQADLDIIKSKLPATTQIIIN